MKVSMNFDGHYLSLRLEVEDECERALVGLMEAYNVASVGVTREDRKLYDTWRDESPLTGVRITLRKPVGAPDTTNARLEDK